MRICYLTSALSCRDGWGRYSLKVVESISKRGVDPVVLTSRTGDQSDLPGVEPRPVLQPLFSGQSLVSLRMFGSCPQVRKWARGCDLIHCLVEPYAPLAVLASAGSPVVMTAHGTHAVSPLVRWPVSCIQKWAYRRAERIVCVSRFTESEILKRVKLSNTVVIPNGVDYGGLQECGTGRTSGDNALVVLSVGALKSRKGYDVSIRAVAQARQAIPNLRYAIIGNAEDAEYTIRLRTLVVELGLEDAVHFLGQVSEAELRDWYHRCDLFLLTPVRAGMAFEGFGLVYLEAGACGKPVIGSRSGGVSDAVIDGQTGLLVPEGDVEATANAIVHVLSNPDLSKRLGQAGQERARELSWDAYARRLEEVYQDALVQKGRRR